MDGLTIAALITAMTGGMAVVITAFTGLVVAAKNSKKLDTAAVKQDQIHVLVNGRLSEALKRITELEARLGIEHGEELDDSPRLLE